MIWFNIHHHSDREKLTSPRRARVMIATLAACVAGTVGIGFHASHAQAAPASRMCIESNVACPNLPPVARNTPSTPAGLLEPTIRPSITLEATLTKRLLHVTGANFTPGRAVRIAVVNVSTWATVWTGSIYAEPSLADCPYPYLHTGCGQPNPRAGTIDHTVRLASRYGATALVVLYHAARQTGSSAVKIK